MNTTTLNDGMASLYSGLQGVGPTGPAMRVGGAAYTAIYTDLYHRDFMAEQVVNVPAKDATRAWRQWQTDADKITKLENEERRLRVRDTVCRAFITARLQGGAAIIIHDGTPADRMSEPFDAKRVRRGQLKALIVAGRKEIIPKIAGPDGYVDEPGAHYQLPVMWEYRPTKTMGVQARDIHHSRLVFITPNDPIPGEAAHEWWWGDSVLEPMYDLIVQSSDSRRYTAHLIKNANNDVLQITGLGSKVQSPEGESQVLKYGALINRGKSVMDLTMIDKDDEYTRAAYSFAGLTDAVEMQHYLIAAAADIPITRMLGRSPGGLNATGEGDMGNYRQMLGSLQESRLTPALEELDVALIRSALGTNPRALWYEWRTPDLRSEKEKVENSEKRAKTFETWVRTGVVPSEVMEGIAEATLTEHGDLPGAEQSYLEWREAGEPEPEPESVEDPEPEPIA